jgi:4-hydroxy-4-methyl-2-oxoglutarate aldolase
MSEINLSDIQKRFLKSHSADIYDVMDPMGYPNQCIDLNIKPLRDDMVLAGPAFTIWGMREPLYDTDLPRPDFDNWALFDKFYPGCVIVLNAEKEDQVGHWGEMMSYGARNMGAVGAVIDGNTRDKAGILNIDNWSCFARFTTPIESKKRWRPKACQIPIYVSGTLTKVVRVNPGDWIFGDCDGVIVIPREILMDVLVAVEDLSNREELSRKALARGEKMRDVVNKYNRA